MNKIKLYRAKSFLKNYPITIIIDWRKKKTNNNYTIKNLIK